MLPWLIALLVWCAIGFIITIIRVNRYEAETDNVFFYVPELMQMHWRDLNENFYKGFSVTVFSLEVILTAPIIIGYYVFISVLLVPIAVFLCIIDAIVRRFHK